MNSSSLLEKGGIRPVAAEVLERFGIDPLRGGALDDLPEGIDKGDVLRAIEVAEAAARDWSGESMKEIALHIVDKHHYYTRTELARLRDLMEKVWDVHSVEQPELGALRFLVRQLRDDLLAHMQQEEQLVFPCIALMEDCQLRNTVVPMERTGSLEQPIETLRMGHDAALDLLARIRQVSAGYRCPEEACGSYRALLAGLERLEHDLRVHLYMENDVLFPRAVAFEQGPGSTLKFGGWADPCALKCE